MNRLLVSTLALALAATSVTASAQTYSSYLQPSPDRYGQTSGSQYDYARVIRVDPVFDSRAGYGNSGYASSTYGQNCYERPVVVNGNDRYDDGYYRNDGYRQDDGYYDPYGNRNSGSQVGGTVATVIGGLVGAAIGSQVGGGSARYATSAIGSMVGGIAGRQIYEQGQRQRTRTGAVRVCDPVPADGRYANDRYTGNGGYSQVGDRGANAYDVTYEYANRRYTTRTHYHPGDRIRVRVDVRPE